jgi:putative phosphoserine phosphatase / 1-acylglycerol-3-phosphate O-acyltransferase
LFLNFCNLKGKNYIAFFDIDDTILNINSSKILVQAARKKKMMSTSNYLRAVFQVILYRFKLKDPLKIIQKMGSWMTGIHVEEFNKMVEEIHKKIIIGAIRPEIIEEIRIHKENRAEVAILSSALSSICHPLADFLGIDHVLCSELETVDGRFTGKPVGKFCFGKEKLVRLIDFCAENNFPVDETYYYGDSIDDLPVLAEVGHPVCVTPDKRLIEIASSKGWTVHQW